MKVVYSFINVHNPIEIGLDVLYPGLLSAFKSVELYGNVTLYTNKILIERFKKFNFPFTDYIDLGVEKISFPFLPKLLTYSAQKDPFIHLDFDLILNEKLPIKEESENIPVLFSNRDISENWAFYGLDGIFQAYLKPGYDMGKKYGFGKFTELLLTEIPNMGIVLSRDPELYMKSVEKVLIFYNENREYFNTSWFAAGCFLEQGLIHMYLKELSQEYREGVQKKEHFIYPTSNIIHEAGKYLLYNEPLSTTFLEYSSSKQMLKELDIKKYSSIHFLGNSKNDKNLQAVVVKELLKYLTEDELQKIELEFDEPIHNRQYFKYFREIVI